MESLNLNICIIGNSHIGSLKTAWDEVKDSNEGVNLTFFGAGGANLSSLVLDNNKIKSDDPFVSERFKTTSRGLKEIDLLAFDVFVLHGLGFTHPYPLLNNYSLVNDSNQYISRQCFISTLHDYLNESLAIKICKLIRKASEKQIILSSQPNLNESSLDKVNLKSFFQMNPASYFEIFADEMKQIEKNIGLKYIAPPSETISNYFYSKSEYMVGSSTITGKVNDRATADQKHANKDYGLICLHNILSEIKQK